MEEKQYKIYRFRKLKQSEYILFYRSLRDARKTNKHGDFVLLRDPEIYKETDNFLMGDGVAGFAIHNGELISVHKNNRKAEKKGVAHVLPKMIKCAFKHGAVVNDCYGEFLGRYYTACGFVPVAYVPFKYVSDNPEDWDYASFGEPNCYLLMRATRTNDVLERLKKTGKLKTFDELVKYAKRFNNYEKALDYRDAKYKELKRFGYERIIGELTNAK